MQIIDSYKEEKRKFTEKKSVLDSQLNKLSLIRFILGFGALTLLFFAIKTSSSLIFLFALCLIVGFFTSVYFYKNKKNQLRFVKELIRLNETEIQFLEQNHYNFENGSEFQTPEHPYSSDIDILGENSLYQFLNRTNTLSGKRKLAATLLNFHQKEEILERQDAIHELSQHLEWRQQFMATCHLSKDTKQTLVEINKWQESEIEIHPIFRYLSYVLPFISGSFLVVYLITNDANYLKIFSGLFAFNLSFSSPVLKKIMSELKFTEEIGPQFKKYSQLTELIELQNFEANKLSELKNELKSDQKKASEKLTELGTLFSHLENIANLPVLIFMNGLFCFHVHQFRRLVDWKKSNKLNLNKWIDTIGDFEELNSFANFSYNNSNYVFPELSSKISFESIHHPLLKKETAVANSIDFDEKNFTILTGSNMSGKSTFLRTIGVGMVLANSGSVVPANKVSYNPIPLIASMRLSDSLTDATSYFYAEVKRLNLIIESLNKQAYFILLDEILRGTNSDDKLEGTIGVVKKIAVLNSFGIIATHDLKVCELTETYPGKLINRCFEVELTNDSLHFDYTLRNGICQNKSASFIMRKMKVID
jgi:DNA mismatch repair ATPase MutS